MRILGEVDLVVARDTTGVVVPGSGRTVAVLGLDDIVVVDGSLDDMRVVAAIGRNGRLVGS